MNQTNETNFQGWFDPYTFIMFVPSLADTLNSELEEHIGLQKESTHDIKSRLMYSFLEFDDTGGLRPIGGCPPLFGSRPGFSFWHENVHYLQSIRSIGMFGITKDITALLSSREYFKEILMQSSNISNNNMSSGCPAILDNLLWYKHQGNRLSASHFLDSEAEMLAQYIGGNIFRFRYYVSGIRMSVVTRHFENIRNEKPGYSEAYLLAESTLGFRAPAVMPLLTYFALSQPLCQVRDISYRITPEDAFTAMLEFLSSEPEYYAEYYHYAYDLYEIKSIELNPNQDPVHKICQKVCEIKGWEYNNTLDRRLSLAKELSNSIWPYAQKIGKLIERAIEVERKYGIIVFLEPYNHTAQEALSAIPKPLIISKINSDGSFYYFSQDFWDSSEHFLSASIAVGLGGASFRMLSKDIYPNYCPQKSLCSYEIKGLCGDHWPTPNNWKDCVFPERFAWWFNTKIPDIKG